MKNFKPIVDKNLQICSDPKQEGIVYYDVRKAPFDVYGLFEYKTRPAFRRMPSCVARDVSENVFSLHTNTAGGRVRFCTDSTQIAIRAVMPLISRFPHMPLSGSTGFDLYIDDPITEQSEFFKAFIPPYDITDGYTSIISFKTQEMRYFTLHFPSYNDVSELYIGIDDGSAVGCGLPYLNIPPVVYYGSSITQGGCSSRPGNAYTSIISRRLGVDHVNLGFSGSAKAEDPMCDYLATLNMSVFVCDYDHNAPSVEHLKNTHYKLYKAVRSAQPTLPIIMVSRPDYRPDTDAPARREVIMGSYKRALEEGDKNVYFVDGSKFFCGVGWGNCTVDGVHPTDLGFYLMAEHIGRAVADVLRLEW